MPKKNPKNKDNNMSEKLKMKMFCSRYIAVGIIQRQGRVRTDLEKSWKMTLVLENFWNSKKMQFVLALSWNFEKVSLIITKSPSK